MNNSSNSVINNTVKISPKRCWEVGPNIVVVIDKIIVKQLGLNENDTFFEQEITNDGILMRIKKINKNLVT